MKLRMGYGRTEHQNGIIGQGDGGYDGQQKKDSGLAKCHEESISHVSAANGCTLAVLSIRSRSSIPICGLEAADCGLKAHGEDSE